MTATDFRLNNIISTTLSKNEKHIRRLDAENLRFEGEGAKQRKVGEKFTT